jgi:MFS family permease
MKSEILNTNKINSNIRNIFRSFKYRNYRLFISGQAISLVGLWLQNVAMGWLVYRLTNSAALLGVVGFVETIPVLILTPFVGVFVDRWNRHRILIITQSCCMILAFIMSFLILTGLVQVWHILVLSVFLGAVSAVDATTRQSFWVEIIENKADLGNAIALNSTIYNSARLLGPTIAGFVIAAVGEGICFLLNGVSYIAVIAALFAMRLTPKIPENKNTNFLQGFKEGFHYAFGNIPIRTTLILLSLMSLVAIPYLVVMPVVAREILGGGPKTMGYLVGCSGFGALVGAIYFASRKSTIGLAGFIPLSAGFSGLSLILFSRSQTLWLSMILIIFVSFSMMIHIASCNTYVQTIVEDKMRGRVISFYTMSFIGMTPFGNLLIGSLSERINVSNTLLLCGVAAIVGAVIAYMFNQNKTHSNL